MFNKKRNLLILVLVFLFTFSALVTASDIINQNINLSINRGQLRSVIRLMGEQANLNVMIGQDVKGEVNNLKINDKQFKRSIDLVTKNYGYNYKIVDGDTLIVDTAKNLQSKYEEKKTRLFRIDHAQKGEMVTNIKNSLDGNKMDNIININQHTDGILVTTYKDKMPEIAQLVRALDKKKKQVTFNVSIQDVSKTSLDDLGMEFDFGDLKIDSDSPIEDSLEIGYNNYLDFSTALNLIKRNSDSQTLANPQLATLNRETANIMIGDEVPIVTNDSDGVKWKSVGVDLEITPRITSNNEIIMDIKPEVSNITNMVDGKYPQVSTKKVNTKLRVKNEKTIAIAGLMNEKEMENISKLPFAGDIPYLGNLFTHKNKSFEKRELIIFITPKIINDEGNKVEIQDGKFVDEKFKEIENRNKKLEENIEKNKETKNKLETKEERIKKKKEYIDKLEQNHNIHLDTDVENNHELKVEEKSSTKIKNDKNFFDKLLEGFFNLLKF